MKNLLNNFPDNCIESILPKDDFGYGRLLIGSKGKRIKTGAHRLIYRIFIGEIPAGMVVRHSCDNPACCNPKHLLIGTILDNNADRQKRKRQARHEKHGRAKLTKEQVLFIRANEMSVPNSVLADKCRVSNSLIWQIKNYRIWNAL
nr:HNH endonuclease signature motif containing protein [Escherichia coli]